jgi:excisionase family DNA binding protein
MRFTAGARRGIKPPAAKKGSESMSPSNNDAAAGKIQTELLTVSQAAARLSLSPRSVWALIAGGKLRAIKLGRRATRIDVADVDRFINDARARSHAAGGAA